MTIAVVIAGCTIDVTGRAELDAAARDAGSPPRDARAAFDAARDAVAADAPMVADSGGGVPDAGLERDAGPVVCMPATEVCNARDDDCDAEADEMGCPCEHVVFGGHVYAMCTGASESWRSARDACAAYGYDLVVITSDEENELVRMHLGGDTWIGLSDGRAEGVYEWVDGTPFGYERWRDPDAPRGTPGGYDCVEMDAATGDWLDVDCDSAGRPYVCEADPDR